VHDFRGTYNVSDYRWFNLRDGDSTTTNHQTQYGILRDDYTEKPAFAVLARLFAQHARRADDEPRPAAPVLRRTRAVGPLAMHLHCRGRRVRAHVVGPGRSATFRIGGRRVASDRRPPLAVTLRTRARTVTARVGTRTVRARCPQRRR
jgi:hypothetical protein